SPLSSPPPTPPILPTILPNNNTPLRTAPVPHNNNNDDFCAPNRSAQRTITMPNAPAIVSQASPGHPPIMSTGCITMENLAEFRNCAKRHFAYKSIPADTQVSQILFCFDDHNVSAWIAANDETLSTLTFENFLL
ncbi:hypothetical protein C0991_006897, partial [Blastosporella zonata]